MDREVKYSELSSVSWVSSRWVILAIVSLVIINLIPALVSYEDGSIPLIIWLIIGSIVLAYPYIHYRVYGGLVKRVPPRFDFEKEFFSRDN